MTRPCGAHPFARMAESVDATVSNTVGAIHPGSSPGPGTELESRAIYSLFLFYPLPVTHWSADR